MIYRVVLLRKVCFAGLAAIKSLADTACVGVIYEIVGDVVVISLVSTSLVAIEGLLEELRLQYDVEETP